MTDWQRGYCDGMSFIERPIKSCNGIPANATGEYRSGFTAGAEDATAHRKAAR